MPRIAAPKSKRQVKVRKNNKKLRGFLYLIFVFFISVVFLLGLFGYKYISIPFAAASKGASFSDISNDNEVFTIVFASVDNFESKPIKTSFVSVLFIDKNAQKVLVYNIKQDILIDTPGRFGEEEVGKILALGQLSENMHFSNMSDLLEKSLEKLFAYKIDRFVVVEDNLYGGFAPFIMEGKTSNLGNFDTLNKLFSSLKTDLTLNEFFQIFMFYSSLPSESFIIKSISDVGLDTLNSVDADIRDLTYDSKFAMEKKTIGILNGTQKEGLAAFGKRVIENMGGRVIFVENASKYYRESYLVTDLIDSFTSGRLLEFFNLSNVVSKTSSEVSGEGVIDRVDVVLILGLDIATSL